MVAFVITLKDRLAEVLAARPVFLSAYCSMHPYSAEHQAPLSETSTPEERLQFLSFDL